MTTRWMSATARPADDALTRAGRWLLAKVWIGCLLSGGYALGRHFGWPEAMRTAGGLLGAVALALAVSWLPFWTHDRPTGITPLDVGLRVLVWAGLVAGVGALLIGRPGIGMVAGALLLTTAWRTFRRPGPRPEPGDRMPGWRSAAGDRMPGWRSAAGDRIRG